MSVGERVNHSFHCEMIFTIPTTCCLDCSRPLQGRTDKKFCNDVCRVRHYRLHNNRSKTVKGVEKILIRNRSLLVSLKEKTPLEMTDEGSFVWLRKNGFDFNFHTHVHPLEDGRLAIMCFEEGYILQGDGLTSWSDAPERLFARLSSGSR